MSAKKQITLAVIITINFLVAACGGQDPSPTMSPDIVEHPLHPPASSDAGVAPDAGFSSVPDAGPSTCDVPANMPDTTVVHCGPLAACRIQWDVQTCSASCQSISSGQMVFVGTPREDVMNACRVN